MTSKSGTIFKQSTFFSFITEGAIEYDNERYESNGDLTVWDAFKIGVKGANSMLLGSGLDIMLNALDKAKTDGVSVPPFVEALDMKVLRNLIKTAKTVHDQKLDRWGPRTASHSGNFLDILKIVSVTRIFVGGHSITM